MRRLNVVVLVLLASAGRLAGQDPMAPASPRVELLRQRIEDRFAARAQEELGLNDEQFQRLRATPWITRSRSCW